MVFRGLLLTLVSAFFFVSGADAATPYIGGSTGFAFFSCDRLTLHGTYLGDPEYDTGAAFSGAVGIDFDGYRFEGEVAYQKNEIDNLGSGVSVFSIMANGCFDFLLEQSRITPFVSAGVSYANVDVDVLGNDCSDGVFAFQLGAGIGVEVMKHLVIDAKYRYFISFDPTIKIGPNTLQMDIDSHNLLLGFRVRF